MEDKNDLNDILLQSEEEEKKDKSNMLLIAAAVLIVFFLGVIGYKVLSDTNGKSGSLPTQNNTGAKSDGFSKVDVEQAELKSPTTQESAPADDIDAKISKIKESFQKDLQKAKEQEATEKETQKPVQLKPVQPEPKAEPTKPAPKTTPPQATQKTTPKPEPKQTAQPTAQKREKFYIQVGSYKKGPNKDLLKTVSDKGYNYKLRKAIKDSTEYTRLYIGPYSNKREAASALIKVSKDIGLSNAFVIRDY